MDFLRALPLVRPVWDWIKSRIGLNREHDVAIFKKLDDILDESRLDTILNQNVYNGYLLMEEKRLLQDFPESLRRIENQYLEAVVRLRADELAWETDKLNDIVFQTFWMVSEGRLKFRPTMIDPAVYDAERKELTVRLGKAWATYKVYRQAVKDRLRT